MLALVLCICLLGVGAGLFAGSGVTVLTGRYLQASGGSHIVISTQGTPVVLNASDGASLFDGLSAGDRVLVLCSGVNACWPGQSRAYLCLRLGGGSTDDLPAAVCALSLRRAPFFCTFRKIRRRAPFFSPGFMIYYILYWFGLCAAQ